MHEIFTDMFRLVCKSYKIIQRSALHTYHSALVFAPRQQLLYKRHCKEMTHKARWLRGSLAQWDPLVATMYHPIGSQIRSVRFSPDSSQLASWTEQDMTFWNAPSGTPIPCPNLDGDNIALADDFSIVAIPHDNSVKLYNVATNMPVTTFTHPSQVSKIALSHDIS